MFWRRVYFIHLIILTLLLMMAASTIAYAAPDRLLRSPSKKIASTQSLEQWQRVLKNHRTQSISTTSPKYHAWQKFIKSIQHESKLRQMLKVNMWFEQFSYKQDNWVYSSDDYWATPLEFLERGGDCEDFAIIKYMSLKQLGFAPEDMKITIVYDVYSGTDHAFLVVYHNNAEFVLDNREKLSVSRYMKKRYKPYYAFNENSLWTYKKPLIARAMRKADEEAVLPGNR